MVANVKKATELIDFSVDNTIEDLCRDCWKWVSCRHPDTDADRNIGTANLTNFSGTIPYSSQKLEVPESLEEIRDLIEFAVKY